MEQDFDDVRLLDEIWAFLIACFSLRDWLTNDGAVAKNDSDLKKLFESLELRICRDLANGAKHLTLNETRSTEAFAVGREYKAPPFVMVIADSAEAGKAQDLRERKYDMLQLSDACIAAWDSFLRLKGLQ
jgi:hypothetical protein